MKPYPILYAVLSAQLVIFPLSVVGAPASSPLFLSNSVIPNIFFEVDDSGSMDWTILTKKYWHGCAYDPDFGSDNNSSSDCDSIREDGLFRAYKYSSTAGYKSFTYVYAGSDDAYSNSCGGSTPAVENCTTTMVPWDEDWRVRSAAVNVLYYDPSVTYSPWPGMSNASFTAARSNPQSGESGYGSTRNLTGLAYEVAVDDSGYSGDRPRRGTNTNKTSGANGWTDLWDSHTKYTFNASDVTVTSYVYNNIDSTGTSLALQPTVTMTTLSGAACHVALGGGSVSCRTIDEAKQNFANWYQYHRRRSFVAKGAIGQVITDSPNNRYGLSVINNSSTLFVQMPPASTTDFTSQNSSLLTSLYSYNWPALGTPLRLGLKNAGDYYKGDLTGKSSPITESCQQNFTVLFTDGYWNESTSPGVGDADGDGKSDTLADVARYYYTTDLSSLANEVPANIFDTATHQHMVTFGVAFGVQGDLVDTDGDGWPNPALTESSNWGTPCVGCGPENIDDLWHAAYNSRGTFVAAQSPADVVDALGDAIANIGERVSSAAAVATNSTRLDTSAVVYQAKFDSSDWSGHLLAFDIVDEDEDANNNGVLDAGEDTNGNGVLDAAGAIGTELWDAGDAGKIPAFDSRNVKTYNTAATAAPRGADFLWASLTTTQQTALNVPAVTLPSGGVTTANVGQKTVDYIRGDQTQEQAAGPFRSRTIKLGDIVNSDPWFVGSENFGYDSGRLTDTEMTAYVTYRSATSYQQRRRMLYFGANDGMLHGINAGTYDSGSGLFNTGTGAEILAYVPDAVIPNLKNLTNPNYTHQYFVDGSPKAADAYINSAWKTVLLGTTGAGGKAVFALDVTDPDSFGTGNVLWEISTTTSPTATDRTTDTASLRGFQNNLGYTIPQPSLVRMENGDWAAIVANGYGSTSGRAVLYIINAATGSLIKSIDTDSGPDNGLSTPIAVDVDDDRITDYIYAGDLKGNLWKFDVTATNANSWDVAYKSGSTPKPLFVACASANTSCPSGDLQPITAKPQVGKVDTETQGGKGVMVYFGTGKYFETTDLTTTQTQTFYGIWDRCGKSGCASGVSGSNAEFTNRNNLQKQEITDELTAFDFNLRVISDCAVNYGDTGGASACAAEVEGAVPDRLGWYLDLVEATTCSRTPDCNNDGERVVSAPILRDGKVIFTTLVPSSDACEFGGTGWLFELSTSGGRLDSAPWDINGDGRIDESDLVSSGGDTVPPGAKQSTVGIIKTPGIVSAGTEEYKYTSGSTGNMEVTLESAGIATGRRAWRQLR